MRNSERKPEPEQINKILSKIVSSKALKKGIINVRIEDLWKKVMGENVGKYTQKVEYKNSESNMVRFLEDIQQFNDENDMDLSFSVDEIIETIA